MRKYIKIIREKLQPWQKRAQEFISTRRGKIALGSGLALLLVLGLWWLLGPDGGKKRFPPAQVIVAPVTLSPISDRLEALGTAKSNESITVTASVTEKVQAIHFEDGQRVAAGDVLVELDHAEEDANLEQARAHLVERQKALKRVKGLLKDKLVAQDLYDRTVSEVKQAKANIDAIQARINDRVIRAPFAGIVGLRQISIGNLVQNGSAIVVLDDISTIKLDFTIPAIYLPQVKKGLKIEARAMALGDRVYKGEVTSIDSRVDPESRSFQVRALLPNKDGHIVPGILMKIDLLHNPRQALMIPEAALIPQGDRHYVMVRNTKDKVDRALKREVKIGTRIPGRVEILSGLQQGEQVITHGGIKTKPGAVIKVLAVDDGKIDIAAILQGKHKQDNKKKQP